jgi:hypothetical protein
MALGPDVVECRNNARGGHGIASETLKIDDIVNLRDGGAGGVRRGLTNAGTMQAGTPAAYPRWQPCAKKSFANAVGVDGLLQRG